MPEFIQNDGNVDRQLMQNQSICRKIDFQRTTIIDGVFAKYEGSAYRGSVENQRQIDAITLVVRVQPSNFVLFDVSLNKNSLRNASTKI